MRVKTIDTELVESTARTFLTKGVVPSTPQVQDAIGFGSSADIRPILLKFLHDELARLSVEVLELRKLREETRAMAGIASSQTAIGQDDIMQLADRIESLGERLREAMMAHDEERLAHDATRRDLMSQIAAERAKTDQESERCQALSERLLEILTLLLPTVVNDPGFSIDAKTAAGLFAAVESAHSEPAGPPDGHGDDRWGGTISPPPDAFAADRVLHAFREMEHGHGAQLGALPGDDEIHAAIRREVEGAAGFEIKDDDDILNLEDMEELDEDEGEDLDQDLPDRSSAYRAQDASPEPDDSVDDDIASLLAKLRHEDDKRAPASREPDYSQLFSQAVRDAGPDDFDDKPPEKPKRGLFRRK